MSAFALWTNEELRHRARGGARARRVTHRARRVTHRPSASLKGYRKIQIQFWELHVGFCTVDCPQ